MNKEKRLVIGQPIGICTLTSLPVIKISQIENTMYFDDKKYLVGRILSFDSDTLYHLSNSENSILVITPLGFIISAKRDELYNEPYSLMDAFLKEQEQILISQRLEPYGSKLINIGDNCWFIPISF